MKERKLYDELIHDFMFQIIELAILIYREGSSLSVNSATYFTLQNSNFQYPLNIGHISVQPADGISDVDSMMVMILHCTYDTEFRRFSKNGFSNLSSKTASFTEVKNRGM